MTSLQLHLGESSMQGSCASNGTSFPKNCQLLAYANGIDIIGRTKPNATAVFSDIEREPTKIGLAVNEGKTK